MKKKISLLIVGFLLVFAMACAKKNETFEHVNSEENSTEFEQATPGMGVVDEITEEESMPENNDEIVQDGSEDSGEIEETVENVVTHSHTWKDATCVTAKICVDCGTIEGNPTGHSWQEATCTTPKTCVDCGITEGNENGHDWRNATCIMPMTCETCGMTEGVELGHDWLEATCTTSKRCSRCAMTEGDVVECDFIEGECRFCGKRNDVLIISDTQTISDMVIEVDVYITSTGIVNFENVIVNGNIYCYGQLTATNCTANDVFAYAYGSMFTCDAYDGVHGKVSGGLKCNKLTISDTALDYAFEKWGKK